MRLVWIALLTAQICFAQSPPAQALLPGVDSSLAPSVDRSAEMVAGIGKWLERETARLATARENAANLRSRVRREEEGTQADALHRVREDSTAGLDRERSRIARETEVARRALTDRVDDLAGRIAEKVLGRAP